MVDNCCVQVVITAGPEDPARATLGFAAAAAAAASGTSVSTFLVLNGIWWSRPSKQRETPIAGFPSIEELLEAFTAAGGALEACSSCLENACKLLQKTPSELCITPAGLTQMAVRMGHCATVVF